MAKHIEVDRQDGTTKEKSRRFDERDLKWLADYGVSEFDRRKTADDRRDKEKDWKEIDRQVAMEPDLTFKKNERGEIDARKSWMAEMELPLQAQALEVLTADANRMMLPDSGPWFRAHAEVTDDYLNKVNFKSIILGDDMQVPSEINQDNADKLVEGFLYHCFRQYDFRQRLDQINAEAFKYGIGVSRGRKETKNVYIHEARGTRAEKQKIPVIVPVSIKNTLLDDSKPSMHSSQVLGPVHIAHEWVRYENIAIAANKGSTDPENDDGGWMPKQLAKVQPDKKGYIQLIELEGDIVVPRKTVRSVVIPGAIITIALGSAEKPEAAASRAVIRLRFRKYPFSSYLLFPYHYEGSDQIYPTSPLMKGRPVQIAATDIMNRLLDSGALKIAPPVGYDPNSQSFGQSGGPNIAPYALWDTVDPVKVYTEIGGDPAVFASAFLQMTNLYAQLTGVLPARLGAQTISHTTAYAKGAELQQGAVRTVDYVNSSGHGPITRWLQMAYQIGRDALKGEISFFIDAYGGYVNIDKAMLPERCGFEWFGSGGPQEAQQKMANRINALQMAIKVDELRVQMGQPPRINLDGAQDEILKDGGWTDLSNVISHPTNISGANSAASGIPGVPQGNPGAAVAAIQNLTGAGG